MHDYKVYYKNCALVWGMLKLLQNRQSRERQTSKNNYDYVPSPVCSLVCNNCINFACLCSLICAMEVYENGLRGPCTWPCLILPEGYTGLQRAIINFFTVVVILFNVGCVAVVIGYTRGRDIFILGVLGCLFLNVDYAILQMWNVAIAGTISETVAQRYHPVAYYTIISLVSLLYFVIAVICFGFSNPMSKKEWFYISFEVGGLFILSLVFVFPSVLHMKRGGTQNDLPQGESNLGMAPANWYHSETMPQRANHVYSAHTYFDHLKVFNLTEDGTTALHRGVFIVGWLLCAIAMAVFIWFHGFDRVYKLFVMLCLCCSGIFMLIFSVLRQYSNSYLDQLLIFARTGGNAPDAAHNEFIDLVVEVWVIYFLVLGLVALSFGASGALPFYS